MKAWRTLIESIWEFDGRWPALLPGADPLEWHALARHDYDEVDRIYVDSETIGA